MGSVTRPYVDDRIVAKRLTAKGSGFVRAAHELGIRVDVWTIDRGADMRRLLGYGVDGIITDRPDVLARLLP